MSDGSGVKIPDWNVAGQHVMKECGAQAGAVEENTDVCAVIGVVGKRWRSGDQRGKNA